ncbi:SIR2 family protein [Pleomorphomonas sp. JP5]|uniref:SIR2 family protein n=1 Tax=Pleomorphomonas sp. JP5 TaxID=2942998 RepID=UPI002043F173|nr:SIR2 family protein [Pleomorphomonas sp. JP5]MCM5558510.1 SIR2 family protein [Pleomorphomonas sp. JP5]
MDFPDQFDPSTSILFLGAGFAHAAHNIQNKLVPLVSELEAELRSECKLPPEDRSELQHLAGYADRNNLVDIHEFLRSNFVTSELSPDQKTILSKKWMRIFTTNYDDSVELHSSRLEKTEKRTSYSTEDPVPKHISSNSVVHLHGYIHKCTANNALTQLVLTHYSYAQQRAIESPWWSIFERDLLISENVFFLGYELNDFEPAKYLSLNPAYISKTFFILLPTSNPVALDKLTPYGTRLSFGVEGFAEKCRHASSKPKPSHPAALRSVRYFDIDKDRKLFAPPTPIEVESLFSLGQFNIGRLIATFPESKYILIRKKRLLECDEALDSSKTLIIHSQIGNGKTIFTYSLAAHLTVSHSTCFFVRDDFVPTADEIEFLKTIPKVVLFFSNYDTAYKLMDSFSTIREDARFVIEVNTSTQLVRYSEIASIATGSVSRINLNYLSAGELREIFHLLDKCGIAPSSFFDRFKEGAEFRDIVLSVFENTDVASRIDKAMKPILENGDAKFIFLCSSILKILGLHTEIDFLRSIVKIDVYGVIKGAGEVAYELIDFSQDRITPHSSILSEFIVKRYLKTFELAGAIFRMASQAAKRMHESEDPQSERARAGRATMGSLLRFSFLSKLFEGQADRDDQIRTIYENGRDNVYIQDEPLFWLQYSIFARNLGRIPIAIKHMETAYNRASARPGFLTYQLDTNSLGLYLDAERAQQKDAPFKYYEKISDLIERSKNILGEMNHRVHVLKALEKIYPTIEYRHAALTVSEANGLVFHLNLLVGVFNGLTVEERSEWGTDAIRASLERAVNVIVAHKR